MKEPKNLHYSSSAPWHCTAAAASLNQLGQRGRVYWHFAPEVHVGGSWARCFRPVYVTDNEMLRNRQNSSKLTSFQNIFILQCNMRCVPCLGCAAAPRPCAIEATKSSRRWGKRKPGQTNCGRPNRVRNIDVMLDIPNQKGAKKRKFSTHRGQHGDIRTTEQQGTGDVDLARQHALLNNIQAVLQCIINWHKILQE